ncbi:MAG: sulfur carrier protein ThiS [Proteobacteria bacterium]|nr:sulfur carrier protein ThiS [Desulfobacula sp.]MBU3952933.1 sulfur carrier protein ThiS [Pseudomonadota bacterium]MBU4131054.1 sulfur carrier protein ThiS [Pseudomonadota bacterium]
MRINLNGSPVETTSRSLSDLVAEQGLNPLSLIVEYNYEVVKQASWGEIHIKDNDTIELLNFVGGG